MQIDKQVPAPARVNQSEIFRQMAVGDSVFASGETSAGRTYRNAHTWGFSQEPKVKFSAKKQDGGVRIWRVA